MNFKLIKKAKHFDKRGYLLDFLTKKELKQKTFGHLYLTTFNQAGMIRGNHYHVKKEEHFGVIIGKVQIEIEDIKTKEHQSFILSADDPEFICLQIGPNIAHAVKSLSSRVILLAYASFAYNPESSDNFQYILLKKKNEYSFC